MNIVFGSKTLFTFVISFRSTPLPMVILDCTKCHRFSLVLRFTLLVTLDQQEMTLTGENSLELIELSNINKVSLV
jgi:hypothetical protein